MKPLKLFMILLGCRPKGRFTEQHDVFFGIGASLKELVPYLHPFWPEAKGNLHVDAWREIATVGFCRVRVILKEEAQAVSQKLFFLNLGGYKAPEFEEYHYRLLLSAPDIALAIKAAKRELFYKHTGLKGAPAHIDDKYGLDVDEVYAVEDILPAVFKEKYALEVLPGEGPQDVIHLGYLPVWKIEG